MTIHLLYFYVPLIDPILTNVMVFKLRMLQKYYLDRKGTVAQMEAKRKRTRTATHKAVKINTEI